LAVDRPKVAVDAVAYATKASTAGPAGARCIVPSVTRFPKLRPYSVSWHKKSKKVVARVHRED
jgi:hypothetical protein